MWPWCPRPCPAGTGLSPAAVARGAPAGFHGNSARQERAGSEEQGHPSETALGASFWGADRGFSPCAPGSGLELEGLCSAYFPFLHSGESGPRLRGGDLRAEGLRQGCCGADQPGPGSRQGGGSPSWSWWRTGPQGRVLGRQLPGSVTHTLGSSCQEMGWSEARTTPH